MSLEYVSRRKFLLVRERLAQQVALAEIAAETGLSTATVVAISEGRIGPSRIAVDDDHPLRDEMLRAKRCPGCGGLVFIWPCLACQITGAITPVPASQKRTNREPAKYKRNRVKQRAKRLAAAKAAAA
jgi:hypothetical protein